MVELRGLLRSQCVDVRIAAIDIGAAFDDEGVEAGSGIAERAGAALNKIFVGLVGPTPQKRGALDGTQFGANTNLLEVIEHGFAEVCVRRVAIIVAGIEAAGM